MSLRSSVSEHGLSSLSRGRLKDRNKPMRSRIASIVARFIGPLLSASWTRPARKLPYEANNLKLALGGFSPECTKQKSKFTDAQIVAILRNAEAGMAVAELLRKHGISRPAFYLRKQKFGGAGVPGLQRLKAL